MKQILLTEKRDGIPCVIIFPWFNLNISTSEKFLSTNVRFFYSIYIWKHITNIHYEERILDHFHLLLACYIFLREILQIESIVLLYSKVVWG